MRYNNITNYSPMYIVYKKQDCYLSVMYFFIGAILEGPEPAVLVSSIGSVSSNNYLIIRVYIFHYCYCRLLGHCYI